MPQRFLPLSNNYFYHVYNRGVEKRETFSSDRDYQRFLETAHYYQFDGPKPRFSTHKKFKSLKFTDHPKIIEIICYCLMPNHFHLMLRQLKDNGIRDFMRSLSDSYTRYYNTKHNRVGPLFQGQFKAVLVDSDEQLLHLSRYIHLNPWVSGLTQDINGFTNSSYQEYLALPVICNTQPVLDFFSRDESYADFINNHKDYALEIERIKDLIIENE